MNKPDIESIAQRLAASLPGGVRALGEDVEKNFQSILKSTLGRLDLVTREDFDVQTSVLARTREKLAELERQIAELEDGENG